MIMADFDSLFADNLGEFQPVLMSTQYTGRDSVGRVRGSGNQERNGSGSPNNPSLTPPLPRSTISSKLQQQRTTSIYPHRRQQSTSGQLAGNNDPFSEIMTEFWPEGGSPNGSPGPSEAVPPLHTDRLLSFRMHQPPNVLLLDALSQPVNARMAAQLHGMFFLAESPWDGAGGPAPAGATVLPKELTCYRRNLFQVSGSLSVPHIQSVILTEEGSDITLDAIANGKRRMIQSLEASISGIESVEYSPVKIITVPWKSAASQNAATAAQQNQPPQAHPPSEDFPLMANAARSLEKEPVPLFFNYPPAYYANPVGIPPEEEADSYKYPLSWKRLQFRSATANNGRRKDLQQHFLVKITIYATFFPDSNMTQSSVEKLDKVAICEAYSGPIIVRGRSPRNFSSRNDIPLTGSAIVSSRHNHNPTSGAQGAASAAKKARHMSSGSMPGYDEEQKSNIMQLQDQTFGIPQTQAPDFLPVDAGPMMAMGLGYSPSTIWGTESNWMAAGPSGLQVQPLQTGMGMQQYNFDATTYPDLNDPSPRLSLAGMMHGDDFGNTSTQTQFFNHTPVTNQENSMPPPQITQRSNMPRASSSQSPSMDLLYEYFPIGIDDWLPPVDVVYRPHNAHHQTQPPPSKGTSRSKRLFSETPFE